VLEVNLLGPFRLSKAIVGNMLLRGQGLVVHLSSDAATKRSPGGPPAQADPGDSYRGYMTAAVVPFIEHAVDRVLATGVQPDLFIDLELMTGYDSEYRRMVSQWGARMHRRFGEVRVFVRSKLVAMGIAVSNLTAANKLKPTTNRAQFGADMAAAVARHAAPP
jgi:NAD(P)-dependent dehydrogenase (short-subunit alcohol dehydrogenase family)